MSDEFALCWNNFADNITTGFQALLVRGNLCDVTLAVDGKLLKAHRVVLSICSPYFQEMFFAMPNNHHPVLILKDMSASLVSNLLEFMYQGSVNVKQEQLKDFMSIAETLQIKGLTTSTKEMKKDATDALKGIKRACDEKALEDEKPRDKKEHIDLTNDEDLESETTDDQFQVIPMPEISMVEVGYDSDRKSRSSSDNQSPSCSLKIVESQTLNTFGTFDFSGESNHLVETPKNSNSATEIPNEVSPNGSNITMLSSTSLLHGNCVFNRNNTVATQAGLKTYWLCKSYRISMCKARCITHQGKVISATGFHNHLPHMPQKPQELPPDHTPNPFIPSTSHEYSQSSNSSSTPYLHPAPTPIMAQPPYYMSQQIHPPSMEHNNTKSSFYPSTRSSYEHCKLEHN